MCQIIRLRSLFLGLTLIAFATVLGGCASAPPKFTSDTYYTQVGMWADHGIEVIATNYQRGTFIPANSKARIQAVTGATVSFRVIERGDQTFRLVNVPKYTQANIREIFERTFAREPVDLGAYSEEEIYNIRQGRVESGMSKEAVIVARGYPPAHETPNLDLDRWRYWVNRFGSNVVVFRDGEVDEVIR